MCTYLTARTARPIVLIAAGMFAVWPALGRGWRHFAGAANRRAVAPLGPRDLDSARWVAPPGANEEFVNHASPMVFNGQVFALLRVFVNNVHDADALVCFDALDGHRVWSSALPPDSLDSWSSPVIDARLGVVVAVSDNFVTAFRIGDGEALWTTSLAGSVVNASPALSDDLLNAGKPANRLFITDHNPYGWASLYAINVDAFDKIGNPYEPGEIVWTLPVEQLSGATPAYEAGVVYLASTDGVVRAVDAHDGGLIWGTAVPGLACFGGVTVYGGMVYAAGYGFWGGPSNSRLAKLNAATGGIEWAVSCERTDSTPIVIGDGRIILAGGVAGFGSNVKVQAFMDHGSFATPLWDTDVDSGGELTVGGWTTQPAVAAGLLYVGRPEPSGVGFPPYQELFILDVTSSPGSPQFVVDRQAGAGGTPAIDGPCVYSIGQAGLVAFCRNVAPQPEDVAEGGPLPNDGASPIEN